MEGKKIEPQTQVKSIKEALKYEPYADPEVFLNTLTNPNIEQGQNVFIY